MNASRISCGFALAIACCGVAHAAPSPALDRISVWLGGSNFDTSATLESTTTSAGSIGKLDLGKGNQSVARARLDLLVFDSQGFSFDYYGLSRTKRRSFDGTFEYDDVPFDLTADLRSDFDIDLGSASYHWWFGSGSDVFGFGLGAAYYRAKLGLQGVVSGAGEQVSAEAKWSDDAVAPVVTIAYKHAFSDALRFYADANGLKKNGGKLSGHLYNVRAGLEWFPWTNVGIGAEYGKSKVSLQRDRSASSSALDIDFHGPSLFARLRF